MSYLLLTLNISTLYHYKCDWDLIDIEKKRFSIHLNTFCVCRRDEEKIVIFLIGLVVSNAGLFTLNNNITVLKVERAIEYILLLRFLINMHKRCWYFLTIYSESGRNSSLRCSTHRILQFFKYVYQQFG